MDINITGEITFFATKKKTPEGKIITFATTQIQRSFAEGEKPIKRTLDLIFDKTNFPEDKIAKLEEDTCYKFKISEGWLTLRRFKKKDASDFTYNHAIYIKKGEMVKATKVDVAKREEALKAWKTKKEAEKATKDTSPLDGSEKSDNLPWR